MEKSKRLVRLNNQHIAAIAKELKLTEYISGFENNLSEQDKARFDYDELSAVIFQVVFGGCTLDKLPGNVEDWVNLYLAFLTGFGTSSLIFNECGFEEYVRRSVSLKDLNRLDFEYQEQALKELSPDYSVKKYKFFNCDYWVRFIDENKCLRYATMRTLNVALYWKLNRAKTEFIHQQIPCEVIFPEFLIDEISRPTPDINTHGLRDLYHQLNRYGQEQLKAIYDQPVAYSSNQPSTALIQRSFDHGGYPYLTFNLTEDAGEKIELRAFNESFEMLKDSRINSNSNRSYISFANDDEMKKLDDFMTKEEHNFIENLSKYYQFLLNKK